MERMLREKLIDGKFGNVTPIRSRMMRAVKGKRNKTTELKFCNALIDAKIVGWVLHAKIIGSPDIYFPDYRVAIFIDGCFWHGCKRCGHIPKTNSAYWKAKIERNIERDFQKTKALRGEGYAVVRFWEHELANPLNCVNHVIAVLDNILDRMLEYS